MGQMGNKPRARPLQPNHMTLQFFSPAEAEILMVLTERMVGTDSPNRQHRPSAHRTSTSNHPPTVTTSDAFVAGLPSNLQVRLRRALYLFQWCPILFVGKLGPFTQLSFHDANAYIQSWAESRFGLRRRLFRGLRDVTLLGYYSQPATRVYQKATEKPRER